MFPTATLHMHPLYLHLHRCKMKTKSHIYTGKVLQNNSYTLTRHSNTFHSALFLKAVLLTTHPIDFKTYHLCIFSFNSKVRLAMSTHIIISVFRFLLLLARDFQHCFLLTTRVQFFQVHMKQMSY